MDNQRLAEDLIDALGQLAKEQEKTVALRAALSDLADDFEANTHHEANADWTESYNVARKLLEETKDDSN